MSDDKVAAYMTLYTVLETMSRLCAPYVPFLSEEIYRNIVCSVDASAPISVHLTSFPEANEKYIDSELEAGMRSAENAAVLGRAARNLSGLKNRQPLRKILICGEKGATLSDELMEIVKGELNVKAIEYAADASEFVSYEVKPQLKTLGPKYGPKLGKIRQLLAEKAQEIVEAVKDGDYVTDIDGEVVLSASDLLIAVNAKAGYSVQSDKGVTVVLDTALDDELIAEGFMREIVSKIQNIRKESGFEVTDHVSVLIEGDDEITAVVNKYADEIKGDVLADSVACGASDAAKETDVNGKKVKIAVSKI
jgi:isoleucyl-tRNA synthetase